MRTGRVGIHGPGRNHGIGEPGRKVGTGESHGPGGVCQPCEVQQREQLGPGVPQREVPSEAPGREPQPGDGLDGGEIGHGEPGGITDDLTRPITVLDVGLRVQSCTQQRYVGRVDPADECEDEGPPCAVHVVETCRGATSHRPSPVRSACQSTGKVLVSIVRSKGCGRWMPSPYFTVSSTRYIPFLGSP